MHKITKVKVDVVIFNLSLRTQMNRRVENLLEG